MTLAEIRGELIEWIVSTLVPISLICVGLVNSLRSRAGVRGGSRVGSAAGALVVPRGGAAKGLGALILG